MKKGIRVALIVVFLGVFLFAAWQLLQIGLEYRKGEAVYEEMEQYVVIPENIQGATFSTQEENLDEGLPVAPTAVGDSIQWPEVDFKALQKVNPDVVAWIYIEGTRVNYPIVQGKDNDEYLYHMINGKYNSAGSIFLDAEASGEFLSQNSPIYGHNMKNGSMFADVTDYKSQKFYDKHPVALLMTPEKNYIVHLFSAYTVKATEDAWKIDFTQSQYEKWLEKRREKSWFASDVLPTAEDRVLTFSTCTYETADARFVLHGILEE